MGQDQAAVIRRGDVTVLDDDGLLVGVIVLTVGEEGFLVENVAVHPARRGRGHGAWLLRYAEDQALSRGFDSLYLYTHRAMTENQQLYARLGYRTYDERTVDGAPLVFMRKQLARLQTAESQCLRVCVGDDRDPLAVVIDEGEPSDAPRLGRQRFDDR